MEGTQLAVVPMLLWATSALPAGEHVTCMDSPSSEETAFVIPAQAGGKGVEVKAPPQPALMNGKGSGNRNTAGAKLAVLDAAALGGAADSPNPQGIHRKPIYYGTPGAVVDSDAGIRKPLDSGTLPVAQTGEPMPPLVDEGGTRIAGPKRGRTTEMTPPFSEQEPALLRQGRQTEFTPNQKQRWVALRHEGGTACTEDVTSQVRPTQAVLRNIFGRNEERIASEWRSYLADPATYSSKSAANGKAFAAATSALRDMLSKCFQPAAASPAYDALDIPKRLGFLYVYGGQQCEAMLLSRDRILTARHCWFEGKDVAQEYQNGRVDFIPVGDRSKKYQVCAAETKVLGASSTLQDEQIVLRIAPVSYDLPTLDLFPSHDIAPFIRNVDDTGQSTTSVVFTWVDSASLVSPAFKDNLAVGSTACYVQAYDSGKQCFTHMCQTYPGTSGGAMFTRENGTWQLLGMHIGAAKPTADALYPACFEDAAPTQNAGLVANANLITKFMKKGK